MNKKRLMTFFGILVLLFIHYIIYGINIVKADETLINYACDYNIDNLIFFRIKVKDLPQKYVKDSEAVNSMSNINNYIYAYYMNDEGTYDLDETISGINKYKNYSNYKKKLNIFYGSEAGYSREQNKKRFLIQSTLDPNNIKCPVLKYINDVNQTKIIISSYDSFTLWDDYGNQYNSSGTAIDNGLLVCYDSNNKPITCNKVDVGKLVADDEKECTYTANGTSRYKITYNSKDETLKYESLTNNGVGRIVPMRTDSASFTEISTGIYSINSTKMLNEFKNSSGKCPKKITCSCSQLNGCYFYDKDNSDCGINVAEDGVDSDSKFNKDVDSNGNGKRPSTPSLDLDASQKSCKDALGANLTAVVKASIKILQIAGAIITIVKGMMLLIPAVIAKDADGLKKASGTLVTMAIILVIIFLLPAFVKLIGHIFDFDLTCFF